MKGKNLVNGPWFVGSLAVLLVNDHILKATAPALITGKLSDFAGLAMAPILIVGTIEFAFGRRQGQRSAWMVALCVAAVFASIQLHPGAADTYRTTMGSILGLANGFPIQQVNILHAADPWDLIALPAVAVAPLLAGRAERPHAAAALTDRA
jgi:hypothetical protein